MHLTNSTTRKLLFHDSDEPYDSYDSYSEKKDYNYNNPGFNSGTGHFTQVVWKKTTKVGVALKKKKISKGKIETYIVARYSPPGNWRGQFQQNVGRLVC
ncbi:hypothetical protein ACROYT_G019155 [Oculina patagonica]